MRWSPPLQNASVALAGEDDDADRRVVAGPFERVGELEQGAGPEGVADLGARDRDLGDVATVEGRGLVADVAVFGVAGLPVGPAANGGGHGRSSRGALGA